MTNRSFDTLIKELSPELQAEVRDFAEFLLAKQSSTPKFLRQEWAGALKTHESLYTSLELQKKAQEWRTE